MQRKSLDRIIHWVSGVLATGPVMYYLVEVWIDGGVAFGDGKFKQLFVIPLLAAALLEGSRWVIGYCLSRSPEDRIRIDFNSRLVKRLNFFRYAIQVIGASYFVLLLILNQFSLMDVVTLAGDQQLTLPPLLAAVYFFVDLEYAHQVRSLLASPAWGTGILTIASYATYILLRRYAFSKRQSALLDLYQCHAVHAVELSHKSTDRVAQGESGEALLEQAVVHFQRAATVGAAQTLLGWLTDPAYAGFVLVRNPDKRKSYFSCIHVCCNIPTWTPLLKTLADRHRPALFDPDFLDYCWTSCYDKESESKRDQFLRERCACWSACGEAYFFEKPRFYLQHDPVFGADLSYIGIMESIDEQIASDFPFDSYVALPVKQAGRVLAVIFLGCTAPRGFNRRAQDQSEGFCHAIGEILETLNRYNLLKTIDGTVVSIQDVAKPYAPSNEKNDARHKLNEIRRKLEKGAQHV